MRADAAVVELLRGAARGDLAEHERSELREVFGLSWHALAKLEANAREAFGGLVAVGDMAGELDL